MDVGGKRTAKPLAFQCFHGCSLKALLGEKESNPFQKTPGTKRSKAVENIISIGKML